MTPAEVDQSIKIERTNENTVLALSNDVTFAILIPSAVKRDCLTTLRNRGRRSDTAVLRVFSAALFLLLEGYLESAERVVIDVEYTGHERDIRAMLPYWIRKELPDYPARNIVFAQVGKSSPAHLCAARVQHGKERPNRVLTLGNLLDLL